MMMIPEAWAGNPLMNEERRRLLRIPRRADGAVGRPGRHRLHQWPADRRDARPQWTTPLTLIVTQDNRIIMASEVGVLPIPEAEIVTKGRLQPGKMLLVDLEEGRLIPDEELKATLAKSHPYREWLEHTQIVIEDFRRPGSSANLQLRAARSSAGVRLHVGRLEILMTPMATTGEEASAPWATTRRFRRCPTSQAAVHLFQAESSRR